MKVLVQPVEHAYSISCNEFHPSTQSASNIIPIHLFTSRGYHTPCFTTPRDHPCHQMHHIFIYLFSFNCHFND